MKFTAPHNPLIAMAIMMLSGPALAAEPDPVTADNWLNHPKTKTVREIYKSVEDGIASGRFKPAQRDFRYCEPYLDVLRVIIAGADGRARKYRYEAGSDDSAINVSHYYDGQGVLRFVFVRAGAVNATKMEYRIYFDEAGERFWHDRRLVTGPGYTFPDIWPEDDIIREPKAVFAAENGCPEL